MRAAMRPGKAATTVARTSAPATTSSTNHGTVALHGVDLAGEEDPELASEGDAKGHANGNPRDGVDRCLPGHTGHQLPLGESERLSEG